LSCFRMGLILRNAVPTEKFLFVFGESGASGYS
jgi:hypothetical protein